MVGFCGKDNLLAGAGMDGWHGFAWFCMVLHGWHGEHDPCHPMLSPATPCHPLPPPATPCHPCSSPLQFPTHDMNQKTTKMVDSYKSAKTAIFATIF
jgi:hypothetical protein